MQAGSQYPFLIGGTATTVTALAGGGTLTSDSDGYGYLTTAPGGGNGVYIGTYETDGITPKKGLEIKRQDGGDSAASFQTYLAGAVTISGTDMLVPSTGAFMTSGGAELRFVPAGAAGGAIKLASGAILYLGTGTKIGPFKDTDVNKLDPDLGTPVPVTINGTNPDEKQHGKIGGASLTESDMTGISGIVTAMGDVILIGSGGSINYTASITTGKPEAEDAE
jgi:hypothetical protein